MSELVPTFADGTNGTIQTWTDADRAVSDSTIADIYASIPENTRRAYARIWNGRTKPGRTPETGFAGWCALHGRKALPCTPETLAEYVSHLVANEVGPPTIEQAMAAIRTRHRLAGHGRHYPDAEAAQRVLKTYRQRRARDVEGATGKRQAAPIIVKSLRLMVDTIDQSTLEGMRDHALLLLGITSFGRRSELAAIRWSDVTGTNERMTVRIRMSKTDQNAQGVDVPILWGTFPGTNPVQVVNRWRNALHDLGVSDGPLLRTVTPSGKIQDSLSPSSINRIVKARAQAAGLGAGYSAHSLRAGGATITYMNGAPIAEICRLGRWKIGSPVVLGYIRAVDQWQNHPFQGVL